jgi:hypothetical protein
MASAAVGQLFALVIATVTPLAALGGVFRTRKLSYVALALQVIVWLEIGAIAYALDPTREPGWTPLLLGAAVLVTVDVAVVVWALYMRSRLLRAPISVAQLDRANDRGLMSRILTIGVVVLLLLNFKPWVGIACVAFNALWAALWIPRRMRTYRMSVSARISAPPGAIFRYLVDPATWKLYRASTELVVISVKPEGPLARGSEIVSRMTVRVGRRMKPYTLESTTVVTHLERDSSYSTVWRDRPSEHATTRVEPTSSESARLALELVGVQPYGPAWMGVMLDVRGVMASRQKDALSAWARLKAILEAPRPPD